VSTGLGYAGGFCVRDCRRCRTVFTSRLPPSGHEHDYASYYHAANLEVPEFVERRLAEHVAAFGDDRRLNRWLDVGCGAGTLMEAAGSQGWNVVGTELSPPAVAALGGRGLDVRLGELGELDLPDHGFDVVSLIEVLEHVPDPAALLVAATHLLRPGGRLWATTPHGRGLSGRLLGARWSAMSPPEHLQLLSVDGIRIMLGRAGLGECLVRTEAVDPQELVSALRPSASDPDAPSRVETSYRLNESLLSRRGGRAAKAVANAVLRGLRLGDSIKVTARRPG
jgi:SAM-dependent methyltransferase